MTAKRGNDSEDAQALAERCAEALWSSDRASEALGMRIIEVGEGRSYTRGEPLIDQEGN